MLSETRPSKVGKWTEPALRVLRERYLTRRDGEVVETPEEMCWRVALAIAAGEERLRAEPRGGAGDRQRLLRHHDRRGLHAQLADPDERGQGQRPAVLGLLRPPGGRFDGGDLRLRQGRGHHSQVGRGHRVRLLAPQAQGRPGEVDGRPGLGPRLLPPRVQRRHRGGEAGGDAPRRQHGHPARRPPRHPGVHRLQARRRHHELQHLRGRDLRVHGGPRQGRRLRPDQPAHAGRGEAPLGQGGLHPDGARGVAHRRSGHGVHRPDQRQPRQPHPGARHRRGHQSVWRTTALAQRGVQPRVAERVAVLPRGERRRPRSTGRRWSASSGWPSASSTTSSR